MSDKKGYICYNYFVGLCNRLNVLIGDMRIADEYHNKKFYLHWNRLKYDFYDIFDIADIEMINIKNINKEEYIISNNNDIKGITSCFITLDIDFENMNIKNDNPDRYKLLNGIYKRVPKYMIDKYLPYVKKIKPAKELQIKIDSFSKVFDENTVSVHVRRGDFMTNDTRNKNTSDKYFSIMDKLIEANSKVTFFVSSDDEKTQKEFREKYGNIVYIYEHGHNQTNRLGENQDDEKTALVSLMLLSKNNTLIATYKSTYSQMAWWLGECKATVYVIGKD
jgi:hypothetical protein